MNDGPRGSCLMDVEHFAPETLDECAALLLAAGCQARPLHGGTDLITETTEGDRRLSMVLDLRRIPELNRLDFDERNGLRIGAAVPFSTLLEFPPVRRLYPILVDGSDTGSLGEGETPATLGAHLNQADPSAEMAPPLICLRASAAVFGPHGWSELAVEALFPGAGRAALQPGEFVVDVRLPAPPPRSSGAYFRSGAGGQAPFATTGVGAFLAMERDLFTCCGARLALCGGAPTPMRALEAERFLSGKPLEEPVVREAADLAGRNLLPNTGPADRLALVRDLTHRAISGALARVRMGAVG